MKIKNDIIEVSFRTLGGEMTSVKVNNKQRLHDGKDFWTGHAPTLFPIASFLVDDTYYVGDQKYQMSQHGFARKQEFKLLDSRADYIRFELIQNEETMAQYPFEFKLINHYQLEDNKIIITNEVVNTGNQDLPYVVGTHPTFKISELQDYYLDFPIEGELLTNRIIDKTQGLTNYVEKIELTDGKLPLEWKMFEKDALIFRDIEFDYCRLIKNDDSEEIKISFGDFNRNLLIWTPNPQAPFICIEPQVGISDLSEGPYDIYKKPQVEIIAPNEVKKYTYIIEYIK